MVDFYQIRSPLSQITEERMHRFVNALSDALGEKLEKVSLEQYLADDFALLYVASGGSEGFFLEVFEQLKGRHCYILTSGESNSLAASMEILSFLNKHGGSGEILHGDIEDVAGKIRALALAHRARAKLRGKKLGCIGAPSDWLIATMSATSTRISSSRRTSTRPRSKKLCTSTAPSSASSTSTGSAASRCAASICSTPCTPPAAWVWRSSTPAASGAAARATCPR